jgi:hypothetical protein
MLPRILARGLVTFNTSEKYFHCAFSLKHLRPRNAHSACARRKPSLFTGISRVSAHNCRAKRVRCEYNSVVLAVQIRGCTAQDVFSLRSLYLGLKSLDPMPFVRVTATLATFFSSVKSRRGVSAHKGQLLKGAMNLSRFITRRHMKKHLRAFASQYR